MPSLGDWVKHNGSEAIVRNDVLGRCVISPLSSPLLPQFMQTNLVVVIAYLSIPTWGYLHFMQVTDTPFDSMEKI